MRPVRQPLAGRLFLGLRCRANGPVFHPSPLDFAGWVCLWDWVPMNIVPLASCPKCQWQHVAEGIETKDISRVSVRFEDHLMESHGVSIEDAQRAAHGWMLEVMGRPEA